MSIGKKITQFEESAEQDVSTFNKIFSDSPLNWDLFRADAEVEIGEIIGPNMRRLIVGNKEIIHTFEPAVLMPLDLPEDISGKPFQRAFFMRKDNTLETNADLINRSMTEKEMGLEPIEYMLLQYFRGSQSPYHTQLEVAQKLNKTARGLRNIFKKMEDKNIISIKHIVNHHRMMITINEEWI